MFACTRRREVLDQRLGAAVELLVEAVDGGLVERADLAPLAVRAAQHDLPVRRGGLLPVDRVHEVAVALGADVQVVDRGGSGGAAAPAASAASGSKYTTSIARPEGRATRRTYWPLELVGWLMTEPPRSAVAVTNLTADWH